MKEIEMKKLYVLFLLNLLSLCALASDLKCIENEEKRLNHLSINLKNNDSISEAFVRSHLGFKVNDYIHSKQIDGATRQLMATGWFDAIDWIAKPASEGDCFDLTLTLDVCPKIENFIFEGNKHFKDSALIFEMKSRVNEALNQQRLQVDLLRLQSFYKSKGYLKVQLTHRLMHSKKGYAVVHINIDEGLCFKIKEIQFVGNQAFTSEVLSAAIYTKTWGLFSWLTRKGRYDEGRLRQDIDILRAFYQNAGYLDVEINREHVQLEENGEHLRVVFHLTEGSCYKVGKVSIITDDAVDVAILKKKISLKENDVAGLEKIEQACEVIRDFYGAKGYVCTLVEVQRGLCANHIIDLTFKVQKGLQYKLHSIYITGNIHTQSRVILRELNLAPGDVLDSMRMKKVERRLQNTGFFKNVVVTTEDCNAACEKNLKVAVEEAKTGSVFFSGGLNNVEKFTFGVTLSQNNFDYKNSKDYFRGAGQKFQLGFTIGKYSNEVNLSFEEPWLYDRELRFGFNLFRNMNKLDSDEYKEHRLGGELYLGKRLFEQVEGKLYYHWEQFKLTGVHHNKVSQVIIDEQGQRVISKIGFLMERDTRDHLIYPTRGTYTSLDNQLAGLGGKTKYFRTRVSAAKWFLINSFHEQTLQIGGKAGYVRGLNGKEVPLWEREFLGGPFDMCGFDYREVGPKTNDNFRENLGGKYFTWFNTEYAFKVNTMLRLLGFFDLGRVNGFHSQHYLKYLDKKSGGWNSDAGIGLKLHILGAPFRINFAFPLDTDRYNKKKAPYISYSFGVSF